MSDKFGDGRDPYLYPGLNIMRNRLGIRQVQRLEQAAYELTALRAATIEPGPWCADCLTCAPFIVSCIRMFLTGPDNCARSIYIKEIPVFAILPTSKKRATP